MAAIEILDVTLAEPLHHFARTIGAVRREQKVDMVAHQDIGMYGTAGVECALMQHVQVNHIVVLQMEAGRPVVAALDDVQRNRRKNDAVRTWHGGGEKMTNA
jgi:hypothetical protein